ncbi:MAG: 30S ribosomal protein S2 [Coriobacteriia bacterium]|nr:30S ribosomal protein S2 [Coriobacteriia bacterium]MCL2870070.1 30S ribosomal protein S2 [Coriobacteriia bacterium]
MATVTMKGLLEAGVHFGHQTRRWNPKMKPYIFTQRGGIYILNLQKTMAELEKAYKYSYTVGQRGGEILFVGTKKQAQEPLEKAAKQAGMPYVTNRWLGGMLTNFETVRLRVAHMEKLEAMIEDGTMATLPKKEQILKGKELTKLRNNLEGIRNMRSLPAALFIVDTMRETIAVAEARRLGIPIIAILDTNSDPDEVDFPIPANDDAIRSISLITNVISAAVLEGNGGVTAMKAAEAEAEKAAAADVASPAATQHLEHSPVRPEENPDDTAPDAEELAEAEAEAAAETGTTPA